jgi:hypothetical protein
LTIIRCCAGCTFIWTASTDIVFEVEELATSLAYTVGITSEAVGVAVRVIGSGKGKDCEEYNKGLAHL